MPPKKNMVYHSIMFLFPIKWPRLEGWLAHLPQLTKTIISPSKSDHIPVRSPSPIIFDLSHCNFQCPASTQLQKRKTYSTAQMHVNTCAMSFLQPGFPGRPKMGQWRQGVFWHLKKPWFGALVMFCWDSLRKISQKHLLFYIKYKVRYDSAASWSFLLKCYPNEIKDH